MKVKHYTLSFSLVALMFIIASADASAQRGRSRYHHYSRAYYYGPRVYSFARPAVSVAFGGVNYRYYGGHFYRPFPGYFRVVVPPVGISIAVLPPGYRRVYVQGYPYYYYNGTYYTQKRAGKYEVVQPPLGAKVPELPKEAEVVVIDGQKYYEFGGTYYKEEITDNEEVQYLVVGTDGVLDTGKNNETIVEAAPQLKIGDRVDKLPENSRSFVISGKKYYESPEGLYFEEIISPNRVTYEVVGSVDEQ